LRVSFSVSFSASDFDVPGGRPARRPVSHCRSRRFLRSMHATAEQALFRATGAPNDTGLAADRLAATAIAAHVAQVSTIRAAPRHRALVWAAILAFAVLAYVLLDGFDLGVGTLFQRSARVARGATPRSSAAPRSTPSISSRAAAAPHASLLFLLVGTAITEPMIFGYILYAYSVSKGKMRAGEGYRSRVAAPCVVCRSVARRRRRGRNGGGCVEAAAARGR
jgi:hypothetical protein